MPFMRHFIQTLIILIFASNCFAQKIEKIEDFYSDGQIYMRGFYLEKDSLTKTSTGIWTYWYENGNKQSEEIQDEPNLTKYLNSWTQDGKQICINGNGLFYKAWTDYVDDSTIYTVKDSLLNGKFTSYIPIDSPKNSGRYKIAGGICVNGKRQGQVTYYYESGEIVLTRSFIDDKPNGIRKEYYKSGILREFGLEKNDNRDSIWTYYSEKGVLIKKETYKDNRKDFIIEYYPNGNRKSEGRIVYVQIHKKKQSKKSTRNRRMTRTSYKAVKNGLWIYYNEQGLEAKREMYKIGTLIKNGM
jgi:uncharacterized protein